MEKWLPFIRAASAVTTAAYAFGAATVANSGMNILRSLPASQRLNAWKILYHCEEPMLVKLATVGTLTAGAAAYFDKSPIWTVVFAMNAFVRVFSYSFMELKVAKPLMACQSGNESVYEIEYWGMLHTIRALVACSAFGIICGECFAVYK